MFHIIRHASSNVLITNSTDDHPDMYDADMEKTAHQFDLKFMLAVTAVIAGALAGWQMHAVLLGLSLGARRLVAIPFYLAPFLSLIGLATIREVQWWVCALVGISTIVCVAIPLSDDGNPLMTAVSYGGTLITLFCLLVCLKGLPRRTTIGTTAIATLAAWWLGFAFCVFTKY